MSKQMTLCDFMDLVRPDDPTSKTADEVVIVEDDYNYHIPKKPISLGNDCIEISDDERSPCKKLSPFKSLQNHHEANWNSIQSNIPQMILNNSKGIKRTAATMDDVYAKYGSPTKFGSLDIEKTLSKDPSYVRAMKKLGENLQQLDRTNVDQFIKATTGKFKFQPSKRSNNSTITANTATPVGKSAPISASASAIRNYTVQTNGSPLKTNSTGSSSLSANSNSFSASTSSFSAKSSTLSLNNASRNFTSSIVTPSTMPPPTVTTSTVAKSNGWLSKTNATSSIDDVDFQEPENTSKLNESRAPAKTSKFSFQKASSSDKRAKAGTTVHASTSDDSISREPDDTSAFGFHTASDIMERKITGSSGFVTPATSFIQSINTSAPAASTNKTNEPRSAQHTESSRNSLNSNDSPQGRRRSAENKSFE